MAKLPLIAKPTFKAKVLIPVAGGATSDVEFTFKHRTRTKMREWMEQERDDPTAILDMAEGWDLEEPLNAESVEMLVQNYQGAAKAVFEVYVSELTGIMLGASGAVAN